MRDRRHTCAFGSSSRSKHRAAFRSAPPVGRETPGHNEAAIHLLNCGRKMQAVDLEPDYSRALLALPGGSFDPDGDYSFIVKRALAGGVLGHSIEKQINYRAG